MNEANMAMSRPVNHIARKIVTMMLDRFDVDAHEWKTIYEDEFRKTQARGDQRRAVDASTGKIITEYAFAK